MDFWFSYIILASIYVLLGLSTNLLVGIAGIFSVSQAAVFGVGAYIVAYFLMATEPMSFLPALGIAAVCCILLNVLVTLPSLRVSGDYFVVTSFGIQLLATAIFTNWTAGTGGANGLPGIPPPDLWHYPLFRMCQTARANGVVPIDGPFGDYGDADGFRVQANRTAILGCEGKWAIHPSQVALANEIFTPPEKEVKRAQDILAAMKDSHEKGLGAVALNGVLVDAASIRQAHVIVEQMDMIRAKAG